jgi:hypothetical protein
LSRCLAWISFETRAEHIRLPDSKLYRPLATCLRDARQQFPTPMPRQIRSAVWRTDQLLHLAQHIRRTRCPAEPHAEMRARLLGLSRSTREDAGLTALYINTSTDMKRQDESTGFVSPVPEMEDIGSPASTGAQTPTVCASGFAASNCRNTYCNIPPLA